MKLLTERDRAIAEEITAIAYCNPFSQERIELEKRVLGNAFVGEHRVMFLDLDTDLQSLFPNVLNVQERARSLANLMHSQLMSGVEADHSELQLYEDICLYVLYINYMSEIGGLAAGLKIGQNLKDEVSFWESFQSDFQHYFQLPHRTLPNNYQAEHALAVFFQIERAFRFIFYHIHGSSLAVAKLRADVWDSIFTQNMRCYARVSFRLMHEHPTLIQGESGTGKELVARAVGLSQYIPFDPRQKKFGFSRKRIEQEFHGKFPQLKFVDSELQDLLSAVNLSGLVPTLIESELFGHVKGAFAGAYQDKQGHLETCKPGGAVFLDELGELDYSLQSKLLRVIQFRDFYRVGEVVPRQFFGKFIAATNRNLSREVEEGRFREDLYFRFCADQIVTCSLRDQIREEPGELHRHIRHICNRVFKRGVSDLGFPEEADSLSETVIGWIDRNLSPAYDWPGNIRELEQCVRNIMIHNRYTPPSRSRAHTPPLDRLSQQISEASLSLKDLTSHYATLAYARAGTYVAAAEKLGIDWKTLKSHIDEELLEQYRTS